MELRDHHENFDWITETTLFLVVWRHVNQSENYFNPFLCKIYMHFCTRRSLKQTLQIFAEHRPMEKIYSWIKIDQTLLSKSCLKICVHNNLLSGYFQFNDLLSIWKLVTSIFEYTIVIFYLDTRHKSWCLYTISKLFFV